MPSMPAMLAEHIVHACMHALQASMHSCIAAMSMFCIIESIEAESIDFIMSVMFIMRVPLFIAAASARRTPHADRLRQSYDSASVLSPQWVYVEAFAVLGVLTDAGSCQPGEF